MVKEQQQAAVKTVKTFFGQILALLQKNIQSSLHYHACMQQ